MKFALSSAKIHITAMRHTSLASDDSAGQEQREAKVANLAAPVLVDKDISRLQVAVDDFNLSVSIVNKDIFEARAKQKWKKRRKEKEEKRQKQSILHSSHHHRRIPLGRTSTPCRCKCRSQIEFSGLS
jgi:hypothetical protein